MARTSARSSYENFNAAAAVVTVHGFSVHPGSAKDTMINAQNVAMEFHAALPAFSRPEHTEGREGFFHLTSMQGDVTTAHLGYIVRDHDAAKFAARKAQLQHIADCLNEPLRRGHGGTGHQGQLLQYAGEDPAALPPGRERPQGHPRGGPGTRSKARSAAAPTARP